MGETISAVRVPFLDLGVMHAPIKDNLVADFGELIASNAFINGPQVREFEAAFAAYTRASRCVGVSSGLDALKLALLAAGIERGDEVVVPADTFAATYEAVTQTGGVPLPVDVTESDYNLDAEAVRAAITERTRFLMPVHLYGQLTDMAALAEVAEATGTTIIEDACQAHGATRDGIRSGERAKAAAFSFYPGKNLGAMGDAGALVTDDDALADRIVALREHGQRAKYQHDFNGFTARLDTMQAIVLLRKLPLLDEWNDQRRAVAHEYGQRLAGVGDLVLPNVPAGSEPVWHLYVVQTESPQRLAEFLGERGVGTGRHYPQPPHLSQAFAGLGYRAGQFPVSERLAERCLSLPMFPGMSPEQVDATVAAVAAFFDG
jgi:dTDP-3-amino-3,4,6-trideoxy-alpha-D-glucose transaminase